MKRKTAKRKNSITGFCLDQLIKANTYFIGFEKSVELNEQLSKAEPK